MKIISQRKIQRRQSGLTLVEMLVATSLLVVIMLGLTAMFNQTQRAFQSGLKQVDVFEGGRAIMDMITRDIEQLAASKSPDNWSVFTGPTAAFMTQTAISEQRTNFFYSAFLLNYTTEWTALGYRVLDPDNVDVFNNLMIGSLYRYSTNFPDFYATRNVYFDDFTSRPSLLTNGLLTRVADGIVHFRLKFYDAAGNEFPSYTRGGEYRVSRGADGKPISAYDENNKLIAFYEDDGTYVPTGVPATVLISGEALPGHRFIGFSGDPLPAMIEVELGILEPQTLRQARSISDLDARRRYLEKQAGKVHIFRQQIPIRTSRSWR